MPFPPVINAKPVAYASHRFTGRKWGMIAKSLEVEGTGVLYVPTRRSWTTASRSSSCAQAVAPTAPRPSGSVIV